jgi:alkanesulfonate monooxygenase SsuD/methylene tetrahydromethanopterin reductase-like flavin-dependent oxidoreductase (luciferase family)
MADNNESNSKSGPPIRFGLWYDFRNPKQWKRPFEELYRDTVAQAVEAEKLGYESVWLTEHHFVDDGYAPSPLVIAAAIAAQTTRLRLSTSLMLLPLHDPVRLAEDSAALSILSDGRFDLGVGLGYRAIEFEAFGRKLSQRPSLAEEGATILKKAWRGESIACDGKRFKYPDVRVTPVPKRPPRLLMGGMSEPSIDRAARLGDGFLSTQNEHIPVYLEALRRHGIDAGQISIHAGQWVIIDDDPERTWDRIGEHALYQLNNYIAWGGFGPPDQIPLFPDKEAIVAGGGFQLWDGPTAVREIVKLAREFPQIEDIFFWAQLVGEPVESGSARQEFFAREVAPKVLSELSAVTEGVG